MAAKRGVRLATSFDPARAKLRGRSLFPPLAVKGEGEALADSGLAADDELIVIERGGAKISFVLREMAYHHVAQGELGGEPYLVSF